MPSDVSSYESDGPPSATPAAPREWQDMPGKNDTKWGDVLRRATDGSSVWSVVTAAIGTFVLAAVTLVFSKPAFLTKKGKNGTAPQLSFIRLLAFAAFLALLVSGISGYLLYQSRNS